MARRFERKQGMAEARAARVAQAEAAAVARVAACLGDEIAWLLAPVRLNAIAEDLRVLQRQRDLDLGLVAVAVILSALARSTDTEGRVLDAFSLYRQCDPDVAVTKEAFRKAMHRAADVLLYVLQQCLRELARTAAWAPLRGRLAHLTDLLIADATVFKVAAALATGLPGSGSTAALKLHAVYSVRADGPVSLEMTAGRAHDSPYLQPRWIAGALYLWDLGYNDYGRLLDATCAGAYVVQRLKDAANPRLLAWYDAAGRRHAAPRGPRGGLPDLATALATWPALQTGGGLDLDVVLADDRVGCVLRVVCVPVDGVDRYYLTNLSRTHFTACEVAELYGVRWEVELLFRDWQGGCRLDEVTRLTNPQTLRAVVYGSVLASLLARQVTHAAVPPPVPAPPPTASPPASPAPQAEAFSP